MKLHKKKLAIVTTHPIQYNAPLFSLINNRGITDIRVFYTWGQSKEGILYDPGFKKIFQWDIPLMEGYDYEFIQNISPKAGTKSFFGIINKNLVKRIQLYNPDAILVYGWSFVSHLHILMHFKGKVKLLFRGDSTLLNEGSSFLIKKFIRRFFLKWVYKHISHALYVGSANKEYFLKHGLKNNQLHFAPHAIDIRRFMGDDLLFNQRAADWRKMLGYSEECIIVLFAGKLEYVKAPDLLIHQFMASVNQSIKLIVAGNGHMENQLKNMAAQDNRISFLDFQNQQMMPVLYRLADIYILPSRSETWGLAVNEAMACGRPVIVSNKVGCQFDLIIPGVTGFVFDSNSAQELTDIFDDLKSQEILISMGKRAKQKVSEYNYEKICIAIDSILRD